MVGKDSSRAHPRGRQRLRTSTIALQGDELTRLSRSPQLRATRNSGLICAQISGMASGAIDGEIVKFIPLNGAETGVLVS